MTSLQAHGGTPATVEYRRYLVTWFAIFIRMNPEDVQTQDILAWLTGGGVTSAIRSYVNSLRSFYGWLYMDGAIKDNPMGAFPQSSVDERSRSPPLRRLLTGD